MFEQFFLQKSLSFAVVAKLLTTALSFAKLIIIALVVLFIGRWLIARLTRGASLLMLKRNVDVTLRSFLGSLISISLNLILIIVIISILGINTSAFVALFASAGVAIGLALSGTLQNFAGGVMILLFKPFKVGEYIEAQGYAGIVTEIQIFNTLLTTPDNQVIFIPNGGLSTGTLKNYSRQDIRRVDVTCGVSYGSSFEEVKAVLKEIVAKDARILKEPETAILLTSMGDSSVNITVRAWVKTANYWDVLFSLNEAIYTTFTEKGINIPFPQMDVHLVKE